MINLNFKNWFLNEVTFSGGKYAGINHVDVPTYYLLYLAVNFYNEKNIDFYSEQDIKDILNEIQKRKDSGNAETISNNDHKKFYNDFNSDLFNTIMDKVKAVKRKKPSVSAPPVTPRAVPAASLDDKWISATVTNDFAGMTRGTKVAMRKSISGANSYEIKSVDDPSKTGMIDVSRVAAHFKSDRDASGTPIKIDEPIAKAVPVIAPAPEIETPLARKLISKTPATTTKKSAGKNILDNLDDPENIEQKEIDKRFEKIIKSKNKSHMIISALAGSGKTTMLKHLAWKYAKPDQKWLYIVFNSRNRHEAEEKFPQPPVNVQTSNSFMGSILRDPVNQITIGSTTNIAHMAGENEKHLQKIKLLSDVQEFRNYANSLNVPIPENYTGNPRFLSQVKYYYRTIQNDAVKTAEYAKKYAINPSDRDAEAKMIDLMNKSFIPCKESNDFMSNLNHEISRGNKYQQAALDAIDSCRNDESKQNDYNAVFKLALYLLKNSLPKTIKTKQRIGGRDVPLGELRDFTDDLWFGAIYADELKWPKYDVVMVDEVQDFNEAQKTIVRKLAEQGAIIVAVGDKNQSIYKFNGADSGAFNNVSDMLTSISHDKSVTKTLTRNFRSRKNIISFINNNTIVNNLVQGKKFADGGEGVVTSEEIKYNDVFSNMKDQLDKEKKDPSYKMPQTAFIARDNESLLAAATECLKKAIPFVILGKNIAGDIIKTIPSLTKIQVKSFPSVTIRQMLDKFDIEYEREKEKNQYKASESDKLEQLAEITGIMHVCVEQFAYNKAIEEIEKLKQSGKDDAGISIDLLKGQLQENLSVQNLVNWMKETFSGVDVDHLNKEQKEELEKKMKEMNITTITSAHRSKGFEFKRVYILRNDKLGSKAEKEDETGKKTVIRSDKKSETAQAEDDIQEENIKYVAYSRAEDELHIIKIQGQPGVKDE